jgi:hypothetical protein
VKKSSLILAMLLLTSCSEKAKEEVVAPVAEQKPQPEIKMPTDKTGLLKALLQTYNLACVDLAVKRDYASNSQDHSALAECMLVSNKLKPIAEQVVISINKLKDENKNDDSVSDMQMAAFELPTASLCNQKMATQSCENMQEHLKNLSGEIKKARL